jgi:hypothetical protein
VDISSKAHPGDHNCNPHPAHFTGRRFACSIAYCEQQNCHECQERSCHKDKKPLQIRHENTFDKAIGQRGPPRLAQDWTYRLSGQLTFHYSGKVLAKRGYAKLPPLTDAQRATYRKRDFAGSYGDHLRTARNLGLCGKLTTRGRMFYCSDAEDLKSIMM